MIVRTPSTSSIRSLARNFSNLNVKERREFIQSYAKLTDEEVLTFSGGLNLELADSMIENVIGVMQIPLGVATGLIMNSKEYLVPMVTEKRSIISLVSKGMEFTKARGGFKASSTDPIMIGQIQVVHIRDFEKAKKKILNHKKEAIEMANKLSRTRRALDLEVRTLSSSIGRMLIVELLVDVRDSMGANLVNSMCEVVAPLIETLSKGRTIVRVLSNLATKRMVHVETVVERDILGDTVVDKIVEASNFAAVDPYRAASHNKGIMDGVSSVLLATSNDIRAVEAGAHAYAALKGRYRPLSIWSKDRRNNLRGELKMPMQVGIVGGTISSHPTARTVLKILGVITSSELGEIAASTGLAYNLAALNALVQ